MRRNLLAGMFFVFILFLQLPLQSQLLAQKDYLFVDDLLDVVIPCIEKDLRSLDLCIAGIKENCKHIRRLIVVSNKKLSKKAEWFDEKNYPFTKKQVALYLCQKDKKKAKKLMQEKPNWVGWYYQQLLKLYAPFVIPKISSNVLVIDSDTVFLNPVKFMNEANAGIYHPGDEFFESYFIHARKLLPGFNRIFPHYSGIAHHMLFQKCVLKDLFKTVAEVHQQEFWKAFCLCTDSDNLFTQGASEYEIYFNFLFARSSKPTIRQLKHHNVYTDAPFIFNVQSYQAEGYDFASFHMIQREK